MYRSGQYGRAAWVAALLLLLCLVLAGAAQAQMAAPAPEAGARPEDPPLPPIRPVTFADLPGWETDGHAEILPALLASCAALRPMRPDAPLGGQGEAALRAGTAAAWQTVCPELRALERSLPRPPRLTGSATPGPAFERRMQAWRAGRNAVVRAFLELHFEPFAAGNGVMTG